jgi:hypothetical protein
MGIYRGVFLTHFSLFKPICIPQPPQGTWVPKRGRKNVKIARNWNSCTCTFLGVIRPCALLVRDLFTSTYLRGEVAVPICAVPHKPVTVQTICTQSLACLQTHICIGRQPTIWTEAILLAEFNRCLVCILRKRRREDVKASPRNVFISVGLHKLKKTCSLCSNCRNLAFVYTFNRFLSP